MKILIAAVIILALVSGGFFIKDRYSQSIEATSLGNSIAGDTRNLNTIMASSQSLTKDIADIKTNQMSVQQNIANASTTIPAKMNCNDILRYILNTAMKYGIEIIPLNTKDWTQTKLGKADYWVYTISLQASGNESDLLTFLRAIPSADYPTLVIGNLSVNKIPPDTTTPTPAEASATNQTLQGAPIPVKVGMDIAVYAK